MSIKKDELWPVKIIPKSENQEKYLQAIDKNFITFGVGPAGCGKTFLAVLKAMQYFQEGKVTQIILSRPIKEAGENLGFLPGTKEEKMDPFLLPLYDAMNEFWASTTIDRLMREGHIEVAPIAYMRGRTFRNAFVILDESQNLTLPQLKMAMTRYGPDSKMVINGDHTQSDLQPFARGALKRAKEIVDYGIDGISMVHFDKREDNQRHPVVGEITDIWEKLDEQKDEKTP